MAVALLALVGAFVALYLTLFKLGVVGELTCSVGSCETVNLSRWATFLGMPVAAWGLGAYVVLLALALLGLRPPYVASRPLAWALVAVSGWSVLFSGWLTYLELFVIHAICVYCVTSAALMTAIFGASVVGLRGTIRASETARLSPLASPEQRAAAGDRRAAAGE
jgi:uncharacterized membrane protein